MAKKIVILSTPRSLSTNLFFHMRQVGKSFHEPTVPIYNREKIATQTESNAFIKDLISKLPQDFPTRQSLLDHLSSLDPNEDIVIKDMVFSAGRVYETEYFKDAHFFFLVRDPADCLVSFYKQCKQPINKVTEPAVSYARLHDMMVTLENMGRHVTLIKSEDFAKDPEATVREMCSHSKIAFNESQMHWTALDDNVTQIGKGSGLLPGWHDQVKKSTGHDQKLIHSAKRNEKGNPTFEEIPPEIRMGYKLFYEQQLSIYHKICKTGLENTVEQSGMRRKSII